MATLTVRNLPDEVHRALRLRAAQHGRSTEAEIRDILASVVIPAHRLRMGEAMMALAQGNGVNNEDVLALEQIMEQARDKAAAQPWSFE